jgi:hypothetical protein
MTLRVTKAADGSGVTIVVWDHSSNAVPDGVVVDIPAASTLEAAYGSSNLVSLSGSALANEQSGLDPVASSN